MQRDPNLVRLSRDHHTGLVLAKRARALETTEATQCRAAWTEMQARFADELEPHFQLEEQGLLPALRTAGEDVLVDRTLTEHAELRRLIANADPSAPQRFGEALATHIRFEEAALFATAQRVLAADVLDALGALHEQAAPPACRR